MSKNPTLLGVLLLALLTAPSLYADEAEDKAVATVLELHGKVLRDDKDPAHPVVRVDLSFKKVTDAGLKNLADLKNLQSLDLSRTQVTDAGVKDLAGFKELRTLGLSDT